MIAISIFVLLLGYDETLNRVEGGILFSGLVAYTLFLIFQSRRETKQVQDEYAREDEQP